MALFDKACKFLTASTDPYHAVIQSIRRLESAGFVRWSNSAELLPGGKYYYTVQNSTLVAFCIGSQIPKNPGFLIIGGHTDSPNLRVKPSSKCPSKFNVTTLGVECYGGGLWHTWFDRDLGISGKVLVRQNNAIVPKLVQIGDPVARISTLCIHLQSAEERKGFTVNKQDHTVPIIGQPNPELEKAVLEQIQGNKWQEGHEPAVLHRISKELDVKVQDICDFDLSLFDTQPAAIGGMDGEFLYSARLDNLATVFCATEAIAEYDPSDSTEICMTVFFDHEEVGSTSANGAGSPVLAEAVRRVSESLQLDRSSSLDRSFCLSIDQAHAVHPNYASKHESQHQPMMNSGIVIKTNSNQRYTTNSLTAFVVRELGRRLDIPVQEFCVRNDCPCGSTIGPTIAALTGIRTVDAGMPQLSMHSCREVMGTKDLQHGFNLFTGFFKHFRSIDTEIVDTIEP